MLTAQINLYPAGCVVGIADGERGDWAEYYLVGDNAALARDMVIYIIKHCEPVRGNKELLEEWQKAKEKKAKKKKKGAKMIIVDTFGKMDRVGTISSWMGIADLHLLIDTDDKDAYQPLDHDSFQYLKYCNKEIKSDPKHYGEIVTFTAGDLTEMERSSVRKVKRSIHKNDRRSEDTIHKSIISNHIIPKIKQLTRDTKFLGGVAGNHMIVFSNESTGTGYSNSEAYIIQRLGGKYCGEGMMLINYHITCGKAQRVLKKILVTHGSKGGSKASIIRQLQKMHEMGIKIDWMVCAHAHDPFNGFFCRYEFPDTETQRIKKHECLVTCLGATRDGIKIGYDDYTEHGMFTPSAGRYPVVQFKAYKPSNDCRNSFEVKLRPIIM